MTVVRIVFSGIGDELRRHRQVWILLFLSLVALAFYATLIPFAKTAADTEAYRVDATNILQGQWRSVGNPPLLPLLLAVQSAIQAPGVSLIVVNMLAVVAAAWLIFGWLRRQFSEPAAYLGAALFLTTPVLVDYTLTVLTDALSMSLIVATLWLLTLRKSLWLVGLTFVLAVLTKYLSVVLAPVIVLTVIQRRQWRGLLIMMAAASVSAIAFSLAAPSMFQSLFGPFLGALRIALGGKLFVGSAAREAAQAGFLSVNYLTPFVAFFALYGLLRSLRTRAARDYPLYGLVLALWGVLFFFGHNWQERFYLPAFPVLIAFAAHGVMEFFFQRRDLLLVAMVGLIAVPLHFYDALLRLPSLAAALVTATFPFVLAAYAVVQNTLSRLEARPRLRLAVAVCSLAVLILVGLLGPSVRTIQHDIQFLYTRTWIFPAAHAQ